MPCSHARRRALAALLLAHAAFLVATLPAALSGLLSVPANTGGSGEGVSTAQWQAYLRSHHAYLGNATDYEPCSAALFAPGAWLGSQHGGSGAAAGDGAAGGGSGVSARHARGKALWGTAHAQQAIWAAQHPPKAECAGRQFLLMVLPLVGVGSLFHYMAFALAGAMQTGRVLLLVDAVENRYAHGPFCGNLTTLDTCFVEPVSSCSLADAVGVEEAARLAADRDLPMARARDEKWDAASKAWYWAGFYFQVPGLWPGGSTWLPPAMKDYVATGPLDPAKFQYWWQAQVVAYVVRPNARTRAELAARRARAFGDRRVPPGAISVHVRHGDKYSESYEQPAFVYKKVAEAVLMLQPGRLNRTIFLSTEDPRVVVYFQRQRSWQVLVADVHRDNMADGLGHPFSGENRPEELLDSLLNLELALECDAWVGTMSSNWCKFIDELRSTVRCKADGLYRDAQRPYPPQLF